MNHAALKKNPFALFLAALAWLSVLLQCALSLRPATHNGKSIGAALEGFFSYFTVLTNLLICVSLTLSIAVAASPAGRWFSRPSVVAGLAASIAFVGLSYHLLLRHAWNPQGAQLLADVLLHYAIPVLYVLYWWFESRNGAALRWVHPLFWSLYPTAYCVYALIRGEVAGSYPYHFIDAAQLGYERTMLNAVGLLLAFVALGLLVVALDRARRTCAPSATGMQ
jgi:hypothetical protein